MTLENLRKVIGPVTIYVSNLSQDLILFIDQVGDKMDLKVYDPLDDSISGSISLSSDILTKFLSIHERGDEEAAKYLLKKLGFETSEVEIGG